MGWELRDGRWYLYRNHRVNGRSVKEYLAARDRFGFGELMADQLDRLRARQRKVRTLTRQARAADRKRLDGVLTTAAAANANLRAVAAGILCSLGYHRHHRGNGGCDATWQC